ncbi:restriction endonuclease subunit S [Campylobacter concisus]|uniref:restriction endonuclease subunit S n=1 Tax=Campylobacter concisus TaxID=199 RepID=UPI00092A3169|nr:restriction endonuclease subunit S [Campylobacter concisus]OJJ28269.1 restriction endonuclease [Campylobacter concisus]
MIKIGDMSEIKTGLVLNRKKADKNVDEKFRYKVVSLKSFNESALFDGSFADEFISSEKISDEYKVSRGDVLLRLREPNFAVYIDKDYDDLIYSSLMVRIRVKSDIFDPRFVAHYLNSSAVKRALAPDISGTTIAMIGIASINNIKIPAINLQTQNKIVKYLNLAREESEILQNLAAQKQKYHKSIFENLIKEEN